MGGAAYSLTFTGGLGLINQHAPEGHRGSTLSLLYLYAYLLQAGTAIGVGALATAIDMGTAVNIAAIVLTVVCLTLLLLAFVHSRATRSKTRAKDLMILPPIAEGL